MNVNFENLLLFMFKVYICYSVDVVFIWSWLEVCYLGVEMLFIIVDICCKELLVEIECFCI